MSSSSKIIPAAAAGAIIGTAATAYYASQYMKKTEKVSSISDYRLYEIDYRMHQEHRQRLMQKMAKANCAESSAIVLDGGDEINKYDTDTTHAFRQESFFQYLFGVREPGCRAFIDLKRNETVLLVPRHSSEWELWCGKRPMLSAIKEHYGVDAVHYIDETAKLLQDRGVSLIYRLRGVNSDSGLWSVTTTEFPGIDKFIVNDTVLYNELVECRVIKTEKELKLMRFINQLSSEAHIRVMESIKPGLCEFHAESEFLYYCYSTGGARYVISNAIDPRPTNL